MSIMAAKFKWGFLQTTTPQEVEMGAACFPCQAAHKESNSAMAFSSSSREQSKTITNSSLPVR